MRYLVCEMEYRSDFSDDVSTRKPIRVVQMLSTEDEAKLLLNQLYTIEGYCEETKITKDFEVLLIK